MAGDRWPPAPGHRPNGRGGMPAGRAVLEQDFDSGSLYALRSAAGAHAAAAGVPPDQIYDVVAAVHELAANAIRHGAGCGRLRLWTASGALLCEVSDDGPAADGASQHSDGGPAAPWPAEHGHGLWLIGQLADEITIDRSPAGTTVTLGFTLPAPR